MAQIITRESRVTRDTQTDVTPFHPARAHCRVSVAFSEFRKGHGASYAFTLVLRRRENTDVL